MMIYCMTATFGKLEHQTLTLQPGLNVVEAPNEWGKSTWCAFLVAMLYGIDTRERSRQGVLADKEHYAPWSGSPMSGRMDICWNGRDITLERTTRGRVPMGAFKAYETETGIPVPELTAENCGERLLGAERSVFARAGFIRLSDMQITDDEALRRRLHALVTTGDESNAGDDLYEKLKALKNRCRHNRTGLLPAAEAERARLQETLSRLEQLQEQLHQLTSGQAVLTEQLRKLENHRTALAYEKALQDSQKLADANAVKEAAYARYEHLRRSCEGFADRETAQMQVLHLEQLRMQQEALMEQRLPVAPVPPEMPKIFTGLSPEQAVQQAKSHKAAYDMLSKPVTPLWLILGLLFLVTAVALFFVDWKFSLTPLVLSVLFMGIQVQSKDRQKKARQQLTAQYKEVPSELWVDTALMWQCAAEKYEKEYAGWVESCSTHNNRREALAENIENSTGGASMAEALEGWRKALEMHDQLERAYDSYLQAEAYAKTVAEMVKTAEKPEFPDALQLTETETGIQIDKICGELQQMRQLAGQSSGRMEALGDPAALRNGLKKAEARIARLEEVYEAASLAMETLQQAATELQRKFAPRIANRARNLFSGLTDGRYERLMLEEDLSLAVCARQEDTLRSCLWRSDGTKDQLYLALRLAVAEELMPRVPLVLDDALVRFDENRLALAMKILKEQAKEKQVILFTCQSREKNYL